MLRGILPIHNGEVRRDLRPIQLFTEPPLKGSAALVERWEPVAVGLPAAEGGTTLGDSWNPFFEERPELGGAGPVIDLAAVIEEAAKQRVGGMPPLPVFSCP
mgnify:CR=1 FL=1